MSARSSAAIVCHISENNRVELHGESLTFRNDFKMHNSTKLHKINVKIPKQTNKQTNPKAIWSDALVLGLDTEDFSHDNCSLFFGYNWKLQLLPAVTVNVHHDEHKHNWSQHRALQKFCCAQNSPQVHSTSTVYVGLAKLQ